MQFNEKGVRELLIAICFMTGATFMISLATFIVTIVNLNDSHPQITSVEENMEEVQDVEQAEEAEAQEEVEQADSPVVPVPLLTLYRAAENANEIIIREHSMKRTGKQQITAIVRFLQENGPSTKQAISNAMVNLGENYSGGSTQRIRPTVSKWLYPNLNKGCIISN